MESFISDSIEKVYNWKRSVFQYSVCKEFVEKQINKDDYDKVKNEFKKCLLNNQQVSDMDERQQFIDDFITKLKDFKLKGVSNSSTAKLGKAGNTKDTKVIGNFKVKDFNKDFPNLGDYQLESIKKEYEILPQHYKHKLQPGVKLCHCMRTKHPLRGNCLNCGRIQCVQEGMETCIACGSDLPTKEYIIKECNCNAEMKQALAHKDKLLNFQKQFYSKLQIIDDFSDWFEISNNTWIDENQRRFAKDRDEMLSKIKEDPEWQYSVNFVTGEVTTEYETVNEAEEREKIASLFISQFQQKSLSNPKDKEDSKVCKIIDENLIKNYINENQDKARTLGPTFKILSANPILEKHQSNYSNSLRDNFVYLKEFSYFDLNVDKKMCLSMHQPWASLLIHGFKRFEGREWDTDYRGRLWIHATSQKPERSLIESIEYECQKLYGKELPKFPSYQTSTLLGYVDLVDCIKNEEYVKQYPKALLEPSTSKYLFVCKNPNALEVPIKMPGDQKIFKIKDEIAERIGNLIQTNTFWWPKPNLNIELEMMSANYLSILSSKINFAKSQKKSKLTRIQINDFVSIHKGMTFEKQTIDKLLTYIESIKQMSIYRKNYNDLPFSQYVLEYEQKKTKNNREVIESIESLLSSILEIKGDNFESFKVEIFDLNASINNTALGKSFEIKLILGNSFPLLLSQKSDYGRPYLVENFDVIMIKNLSIEEYDKHTLTVPQIIYDMSKTSKQKQGTVIISFKYKLEE